MPLPPFPPLPRSPRPRPGGALAGLAMTLLAALLILMPPRGALPAAWADFSGVDYTLTNQNGKDFSGENLANTSFAGANLHGAILTQAAFPEADFSGADLSDALMDKVDFSGADFQGAVLRGVIATGSNFHGARIRDADFSDALIDRSDQRALCQEAEGTNPVTGVDTRLSLECG